MKRRIVITLAACIAAATPAIHAQTYPSKPLKLIVPYPPGGSTDIIGRLIAQKLADAIGQPVTVDNRSGANGNIGAEVVAHSAPDGYTFLIGGAANAINATFYKKLPFDFLTDLTPIAMIGAVPNIMVVPNSVPAKTPQEFVVWAKIQPNGISYASTGNGATTHMAGEQFKAASGVVMTHVPYRGAGAAFPDVMAGRTQAMFDNMTSAMQQVNAGYLRAIALTGSNRNSAAPNVPTFKESGFDVDAETWFGMFMPAATPRPILERLNQELRHIVQQPDMRAKLAEFGVGEVRDMNLVELKSFTESDVRKWAKVIQAAGVSAP